MMAVAAVAISGLTGSLDVVEIVLPVELSINDVVG